MKVTKITKLTDCKWLNLFEAEFIDDNGEPGKWTFSSRLDKIPTTPVSNTDADAVVIVPLHRDKDGVGRLVTIEEFRIPIRCVEFEFPAGLIEPGDSPGTTATKELFQETGLKVTKIVRMSQPVYSSAGMTDESTIIVFVECEGELSSDHLEGSESIKAVLLNHQELVAKYNDPDVKFGAKAWAIIDGLMQAHAAANGRPLTHFQSPKSKSCSLPMLALNAGVEVLARAKREINWTRGYRCECGNLLNSSLNASELYDSGALCPKCGSRCISDVSREVKYRWVSDAVLANPLTWFSGHHAVQQWAE